MPRLVAVLTVMAALALGCDTAPPEPTPSDPSPSVSSETIGGDPVDLIGWWRVSDAQGEEDGARLRVDARSMELHRSCGAIHASWTAAHDGLFVAGSQGWSGECGPDPWPDWLEDAAAHRTTEDGHALLDEAGHVLARLTPADADDAQGTVGATGPPVVDEQARRDLAPAEPLPDDATPADAASLLGRWVPAEAPSGSEAHLRFDRDGSWHGSDGCNGVGGRWRSGTAGALLGTTGVQTLIGCENLPVAEHMGKVARAGLQGDDLVLFDRRGLALGVYHRSP